jgi:hypothetical protein
MDLNTTPRSRARRARNVLGLGWSLLAAYAAGCARPPEVRELPEAARKAVFQKKVDVEQRVPKSSRGVPGSSKGPSAGPRP